MCLKSGGQKFPMLHNNDPQSCTLPPPIGEACLTWLDLTDWQTDMERPICCSSIMLGRKHHLNVNLNKILSSGSEQSLISDFCEHIKELFKCLGHMRNNQISRDLYNRISGQQILPATVQTNLIFLLPMLLSSPCYIAYSMRRHNLSRDQGTLVVCSSHIQLLIVKASRYSIRGYFTSSSIHPAGCTPRWGCSG